MKKRSVLNKPTRLSDLSFDELDDADTRDLKVERIEVRKLRAFKHQSS